MTGRGTWLFIKSPLCLFLSGVSTYSMHSWIYLFNDSLNCCEKPPCNSFQSFVLCTFTPFTNIQANDKRHTPTDYCIIYFNQSLSHQLAAMYFNLLIAYRWCTLLEIVHHVCGDLQPPNYRFLGLGLGLLTMWKQERNNVLNFVKSHASVFFQYFFILMALGHNSPVKCFYIRVWGSLELCTKFSQECFMTRCKRWSIATSLQLSLLNRHQQIL